MTSKHFLISSREAENRLSSTIQHKLRIVMKCYTISNFNIENNNNTFSFNKTNRIRGIKLIDKNNYTGSFVLEKNPNPLEDKEYTLIINVG